MQPFFIRFVNRETTQILLDIIGDYCQSRSYFGENKIYRLRFHITKRNNFGTIYVEQFVGNQVIKRRYLNSYWWDSYTAKGSMFIVVKLESTYEKLKQLGTGIKQQIKACYEIDNYHLRRRSRR